LGSSSSTAQRSAPRGLSYIAQSLVREKVHVEFQTAKIGKPRFAGQNSWWIGQ